MYSNCFDSKTTLDLPIFILFFFLQWISADRFLTICIWSVCVLLSLSCWFLFVLLLLTWCKGHRGKDWIYSNVALPGEEDSDWLHVESYVTSAELPLRSAKSSQADTSRHRRKQADSGLQLRSVGQSWTTITLLWASCGTGLSSCLYMRARHLSVYFPPFQRGLQQLSSLICLSETSEQRDTDTHHTGFCLLCCLWCCVPITPLHLWNKMILIHSTVPLEDMTNKLHLPHTH